MKNKILKKLNIFCIIIGLLIGSVNSYGASVIYAPTTVPTVSANDGNSGSVIMPESEVYASLNEDASMANYYAVFNIFENNGNYYCNDNGKLVVNAWRKISKYSFAQFAPVDDFPEEYIWAFFGAGGKALKSTNGKIRKYAIGNSYYAFNEYGQMLQGFFNESGEMWDERSEQNPFYLINDDKENLYHADEISGALTSGWLIYAGNVEKYPNKNIIWLYFNPSTHRVTRTTSSNYKSMTINGSTYAFDDVGIMLTGFEAYQYNEEHGGNTSRVPYFNESGAEVKNGFMNVDFEDEWASDIYENDEYDDYDNITIYLNKNGKMYKNTIKQIDSGYYGFDDNGVMVKGLSVWNGNEYVTTINAEQTSIKQYINSGKYVDRNGVTRTLSSNDEVHYFNQNGKRVTSSVSIEFREGSYTFSANNLGALNGLHNKKYYAHGILMKPESGVKFGVYIPDPVKENYTMAELELAGAVVVNSSGTVINSTTGQKDENDYYWLVNGSRFLNVYSVNVKKQGTKYYFRGTNSKGNEEWIEFGEKDHYGRTCVTDVMTNGKRTSSGAVSYYQVKITNENALNFTIK